MRFQIFRGKGLLKKKQPHLQIYMMKGPPRFRNIRGTHQLSATQVGSGTTDQYHIFARYVQSACGALTNQHRTRHSSSEQSDSPSIRMGRMTWSWCHKGGIQDNDLLGFGLLGADIQYLSAKWGPEGMGRRNLPVDWKMSWPVRTYHHMSIFPSQLTLAEPKQSIGRRSRQSAYLRIQRLQETSFALPESIHLASSWQFRTGQGDGFWGSFGRVLCEFRSTGEVLWLRREERHGEESVPREKC